MRQEDVRKAYEIFIDSFALDLKVDTKEYDQKYYVAPASDPKVCRFCNNSGKTSFKTDAHVIPRLLGSRYLLSHFECDECNQYFKRCESDLANFIRPIRSINGITGKSKTPKYKDDNITIFQDEENTIRFASPEVIAQLDAGARQLELELRRGNHIPINVYRALLKIALSFVKEDEVNKFERAFDFLMERDEDLLENHKSSLKIVRIFVPGPPIPEFPVVEMWKRKNMEKEIHDRVMVLHIRNMKFQLPIPFNGNDNHLKGKSVDFPVYPVFLPKEFIERFGSHQYEVIDLSDRTPQKGMKETIGLNVRDLKKNSR